MGKLNRLIWPGRSRQHKYPGKCPSKYETLGKGRGTKKGQDDLSKPQAQAPLQQAQAGTKSLHNKSH